MGAIDEYEHLKFFQSNSILSWLGLLWIQNQHNN